MSTAKIEDKLRKLLRLAQQHDSAEEAAVAYAQAQRIATLNGLRLDEVAASEHADEPEPPLVVEKIERMCIDTSRKTVVWRSLLALALAEANNCRMYRSITEQIERLAREAVQRYQWDDKRRYGRGFRLGAVAEVERRLPSPNEVVKERRDDVDARRQQAIVAADAGALASSTTALARVCAAEQHLQRVSQAIDAFEVSVGLKLRKRGFASADANGYHDGRRAGQSIGIKAPAKGLGA